MDPLADKYADLNPYNYAGNKPINKVDIDGLQEENKEETKTPQKNGEHNKAAVYLQGHLGGDVDLGKNSSSVTAKLKIDDLELEIKVDFTESMAHSDIIGILEKWGMDNASSFSYYMFKYDYDFSFERLGIWADNYLWKEPPGWLQAEASVIAAPAIAIDQLLSGKNTFTGEGLSGLETGLSVLDLIPGEALAKLGIMSLFIKVGNKAVDILPLLTKLPGANQYGECKEFCSAFMKGYGKVLDATEITLKSSTYLRWGVGSKGITSEGFHKLSEVIIDGKNYIFDNLHPNGILKSDFIDTLEIMHKTGNRELSKYGQEAWEIISK